MALNNSQSVYSMIQYVKEQFISSGWAFGEQNDTFLIKNALQKPIHLKKIALSPIDSPSRHSEFYFEA